MQREHEPSGHFANAIPFGGVCKICHPPSSTGHWPQSIIRSMIITDIKSFPIDPERNFLFVVATLVETRSGASRAFPSSPGMLQGTP